MIAVAAAALLSACSPAEYDSDRPAGAEGTPSQAAPTTSAESAPGKACTAEDFEAAGDAGQKPELTLPKDCAPPAELLVIDAAEGDGPAVKAGDTAVVHYVGSSLSTGEQFDASWDRGEPFPVENVGQAGVIPGWNEGLLGLKEGGRRILVIPPDKGYGEAGSPPVIAPNETLVFVIDAVEVSGA